MFDYTGQIVQATAGRDSGDVFFVVGQTADGRLLLADGKRRKAARPKAKKLRHVRLLHQEFDHPVIQKLQQGKPASDRELRQALAAFKGGITFG